MPKHLRVSLRLVLMLMVASVFVVALPAVASPTHERIYSYYGYDYGSGNDDHCTCRVGPCFPSLIGQKTLYCNGGSYSWGVTTGTCFDHIDLEEVPCGTGGTAAATDAPVSEPAGERSEVFKDCLPPFD